MVKAYDIRRLFQVLAAEYGPQHWWPAIGRFEVMVGAVLVQRTAWTSVAAAVERLREAGALDQDTLALMSASRLEPLLRGVGFHSRKALRLISLARWVQAHGGMQGLDALETASLRSDLLARDGVGPETADTILLYAFDRPVFIVDNYALRLFRRLGMALPEHALRLQETVTTEIADAEQLNELHALIVAHGKRHCRARPQCTACCLRERCAQQLASVTPQRPERETQTRADR